MDYYSNYIYPIIYYSSYIYPIISPETASESLRNSALHEMEQRMELLSADIVHKQTLFKQYQLEADQRMDAIRLCGTEIGELRHQVCCSEGCGGGYDSLTQIQGCGDMIGLLRSKDVGI